MSVVLDITLIRLLSFPLCRFFHVLVAYEGAEMLKSERSLLAVTRLLAAGG